jgi:Holliday junction resolvase RusA-like endonuclease
LDGLGKNKLAYQDDAAVTTVIARKFYGDEPKVVVRISHDKSIVQDIS